MAEATDATDPENRPRQDMPGCHWTRFRRRFSGLSTSSTKIPSDFGREGTDDIPVAAP